MKKPHVNGENYIYSVTVGKNYGNDEFHLELFDFNADFQCDGKPCKIITTFDELFSLFDEFDEHL